MKNNTSLVRVVVEKNTLLKINNNVQSDLVYYKSKNIVAKHGFSTRFGGVSSLPHTKELNLAFGRGDDTDTVLENLKIFANALEIDEKSIISVPQIHSNEVMVVDGTNCGEGYFLPHKFSCDGYVTKEKNIALGVKIADCVPILLEDSKNCVISAVHAGWRGTVQEILSVAVEKMLLLGAEKENIKAIIGPSICMDCYEVGEDFYRGVCGILGKSVTDMFVRVDNYEKHHADLVSLNEYILKNAGILAENIEKSNLCTCCKKDEFFTHRGQNGIRGTLLALISQ